MAAVPVPAPHPATLDPNALMRDCAVTRTRGSGPGGQHRNKVETAVVLTHTPTGTTGQASERRSQEANRKVALFRLRVNLALAIRTAPGVAPSATWASRVKARRLAINPSHDDFPALLAEALDHLHQHRGNPAPAAAVLGVSATQLIKLLRHDPRALEQVNALRATRGQHPLR